MCIALDILLTEVSNNRTRSVAGQASHAFKKEVAMNGRNMILSVRLGEDIIVRSSPGERSVTYLGPVLRQDPSIGSTYMGTAIGCRGWTCPVVNTQVIIYHASHNCHDSIDYWTNHEEKYQL